MENLALCADKWQIYYKASLICTEITPNILLIIALLMNS